MRVTAKTTTAAATTTTAKKNSKKKKNSSKSSSLANWSTSTTATSSTSSSSSTSSPAEISKQIKLLLKQQQHDVRADITRLDELRKIFAKLESSGELVFNGNKVKGDENSSNNHNTTATTTTASTSTALVEKWNTFLHTSHKKMVDQLCDRITFNNNNGSASAANATRHASIRCLWGVIGSSPLTVVAKTKPITTLQEQEQQQRQRQRQQQQFSSSYKILDPNLLKRWMKAMIERQDYDDHYDHHHHGLPPEVGSSRHSNSSINNSKMDQGLRHMVESEFLLTYKDVQYYCLQCISNLATETYNNHNNNNNEQDDNDDDDDDTSIIDTTANGRQGKDIVVVDTTVIADRLLELLMMIPVPNSQDDMVPTGGESTNGKSSSSSRSSNCYLVPPPPSLLQKQSLGFKATEEEDSDIEEEEHDEDDEDSSMSSDDDSESGRNSNKQQSLKTKKNKKTVTNSNKKKKKDDGLLLLPYQQIRAFRKEYQRAWLAVLRLPLSIGSLKRALIYIPQYVLDFVNHPLRFADFFMQAYGDTGSGSSTAGIVGVGIVGIVGVLALDGLFQLITQYDLEYPNFYKQLYKLVTARVMHVKYRSRFFDLLNRCLVRNEMLPAHVVAAFIKRLTRCALSSPPPAILFILALVSNLIRKHPECSCLIHRNNTNKKKVPSDDGGGGGGDETTKFEFEDGYDAEQDDPVKSNALQSSLWELAVLERHYYPAVATLAKSIGTTEEIKAPSYDVMGDFVQHTYKTLFDQERKRYNNNHQHDSNHKSLEGDNHDRYDAKKRKTSKTALVYTEPTSLFTETDVFASFLSL